MNKTDRRNTDVSKANSQRLKNADEFALMIAGKLDDIQRLNNYEFKGLSDRAFALNHMGIKTRHGCEWSNNSVKRILDRVISII